MIQMMMKIVHHYPFHEDFGVDNDEEVQSCQLIVRGSLQTNATHKQIRQHYYCANSAFNLYLVPAVLRPIGAAMQCITDQVAIIAIIIMS